jgi:hypothetical protein
MGVGPVTLAGGCDEVVVVVGVVAADVVGVDVVGVGVEVVVGAVVAGVEVVPGDAGVDVVFAGVVFGAAAFFCGVVVVVGTSGGAFRGDPGCGLREEPVGLEAVTRDRVEVGCVVACAGFVCRDRTVGESGGVVTVDAVAVADDSPVADESPVVDDLPVADALPVVDGLAVRDRVVMLLVARDLWRSPAEPRAFTGRVPALVDVVIALVVVDWAVVGIT